jgi:hypothetical protein
MRCAIVLTLCLYDDGDKLFTQSAISSSCASERLGPPVELSRPIVIRVVIVVFCIPVSGRLRRALPLPLLLLLLPLLQSASTRTHGHTWSTCTMLASLLPTAAQQQRLRHCPTLLNPLLHSRRTVGLGGGTKPAS